MRVRDNNFFYYDEVYIEIIVIDVNDEVFKFIELVKIDIFFENILEKFLFYIFIVYDKDSYFNNEF